MVRNPRLESSLLRTPRRIDKDDDGPVEHSRWSPFPSNQVPSTIPAGVAKTLKEYNVQYQAFALAIWDADGNLSFTHTSPALNGFGEAEFHSKLPRTVSRPSDCRNPQSKWNISRYDNGEAHTLAPSLADGLDGLTTFEDYGPKDARGREAQAPSRIPNKRGPRGLPNDLSRPSRPNKSNVKAQSGALPSQSPQDDRSPDIVAEEYLTLVIGDTPSIDEFYKTRFWELQQTVCKYLAKTWIKVVEPQKQSSYPYSRQKAPAGQKPPWWPEWVIHKEPDHIKKHDRIDLLVALLRVRVNQKTGEPMSAVQLEKSSETDTKIPHHKHSILMEIVRVRTHEEEYEDNQHDSDSTINVKKSPGVKKYPKRSKNSSIGIKDEAQDDLASEQERRNSSTDGSSVCSSSRGQRSLQISHMVSRPSTIHSPVNLIGISNDDLQRPMMNQPRSSESITVCNTPFQSSQDQPASGLMDEMYLDYTRQPPVQGTHTAGQGEMDAGLQSIHGNLPFASTHHGINMRNPYHPVAVRAATGYGSCYTPSMVSQYTNQMQMDYAQSLSPLSAHQQASTAVQQHYQTPLSGHACNTLSQPTSNQALDSEASCSRPELKSEEQSFQGPFQTETYNQHHGLPHPYVQYISSKGLHVLDASSMDKKRDRIY
ncbi:MAG: hypothetical protein M1812_002323 [Candelaria pacifica]|nr:MAG: hypothetical protein M1812_002323 [Candelaria pacifica]